MPELGKLVQDVVATPLGSVIASVGQGVAAAQQALDEASLAAVLDLVTDTDDEKLKLLQAIGYRPTFYALPETTGQVRVALKLGGGAAGVPASSPVKAAAPATGGAPVAVTIPRLGLVAPLGRLYATPVDAGYANQYGYSADISATISFKIVPVPPPDGVENLRLLPDLVGVAADIARDRARNLGLEVLLVDAAGASVATPASTAKVTAQEPMKGTIATTGDEVRLTVA